jgi:hypothetical protein
MLHSLNATTLRRRGELRMKSAEYSRLHLS